MSALIGAVVATAVALLVVAMAVAVVIVLERKRVTGLRSRWVTVDLVPADRPAQPVPDRVARERSVRRARHHAAGPRRRAG